MPRRTTVAPSTDSPGSPDSPATSDGGSLRETAIRSGVYLVGREAVGIGVRLLGLVLVMRRIGPAEFGIYGAAAAYVILASTLAQMGAEVFLIRQPGPLPRRRYDEVFTTLLVTSAVVVVVGLALSFAVAPWLRPVGVVVPARVMVLSVPLNVLWAPMQACIERQFAYRRLGFLEVGSDVVLYGTAVPLAFLGAGPWSLIAGFFAWQAWRLVGSMALSGLWPRLAWSSGTARELIAHGRTYALTTWIAGARAAILTLIVGTYAGATGVGLVNFAQRMVTTMNFTDRGVHRIGMVAISKASRERPGRLSVAMEEGTLLLQVVAAVPFVAFGLAAPWVVPDVFGRDWLPAMPVYVLLALWAMLRVPVTVQRTLLYAHGRNIPPAITSMIELVLVSTVALVAVRQLGIVGFGIASVVAVSSSVYTHHAARRLVELRYRRLVLPMVALVPPVFAAVVPVPWAFLLLLVPVSVLALPSMRAELRHLISTARATVGRPRAAGAAPSTPQPAPAVVTALPVRTPPRVATLGAPGTGGREMAMNGSSRTTPNVSLFPPFQAWRLQAGSVVDPTNPRIADRASLDAHGLTFRPTPPAAGDERRPGGHEDGSGRPDAPVHVDGTASGSEFRVPDMVQALLAETDPVTGLPSPVVLLARLGRLLGAVRETGWTLAVVAVELRRGEGARPGAAPEEMLADVAEGLRAELRFDDLVARVGAATFVAAVTLVGRGLDGIHVAAHVEGSVRAALAASGHRALPERWTVRSAHEVVPLPCDRDADELVRRVLEALDG